jgi:hypothetical protein
MCKTILLYRHKHVHYYLSGIYGLLSLYVSYEWSQGRTLYSLFVVVQNWAGLRVFLLIIIIIPTSSILHRHYYFFNENINLTVCRTLAVTMIPPTLECIELWAHDFILFVFMSRARRATNHSICHHSPP